MCNYARICQDICRYNLVYNFSIQLLQLQSSFLVQSLAPLQLHFNRILAWERGISKRLFLELNCFFPFICYIANIGVGKYLFTRVIFKLKICPLFRTCVFRVALVALILLMQHSSLTCVAHVSLVSHSYQMCFTRVARVALVTLVSDTRVVKQTRSFQTIDKSQRLLYFCRTCYFKYNKHQSFETFKTIRTGLVGIVQETLAAMTG